MLQVLARQHGVAVDGKRGPKTYDALRRDLRHAGALSRRADGWVGVIQNTGNLASHFPQDDDHELTAHDAEVVLRALDALLAAVDADVAPPPRRPAPAPTTAPTGGTGWWPWLAAPVLFGAVALGTFAIAAWGLDAVLGDAPPPARPLPLDPLGDPSARLEQDPAAPPAETDRPEASDPRPLDAALAAIGRGAPLPRHAVERLSCADLTRLRAAVWAQGGWRFDDPDLRQWLAEPARAAALGLAAAEPARQPAAAWRALGPDGQARSDHLTDRLEALGCGSCARKRPCPE